MPVKKLLREDYERAVKAFVRYGTVSAVREVLRASYKFARKLVKEGHGDYPSIESAVADMDGGSEEEKKDPMGIGIDPKMDRKFYAGVYKTVQRKALEAMQKGEVPDVDPKVIKGIIQLRNLGRELVKEGRQEFDVIALPVDDMTEKELADLAMGKGKTRR